MSGNLPCTNWAGVADVDADKHRVCLPFLGSVAESWVRALYYHCLYKMEASYLNNNVIEKANVRALHRVYGEVDQFTLLPYIYT